MQPYFLLHLSTPSFADDTNARAIMEKVDARDDGKTIEEDMLMVLIDKNGKQRTRDLKSYSKDFGEDERELPPPKEVVVVHIKSIILK